MKLHEKNFSYKRCYSPNNSSGCSNRVLYLCHPFLHNNASNPPPSLFLVFMITKITTGLISWESEQLWATLQEWHCSSVWKFLRGKALYYSVYNNIVHLGTIWFPYSGCTNPLAFQKDFIPFLATGRNKYTRIFFF